MPAFNVNVPEPQKRFNVLDPEDPIARKLQVAQHAAVLIQQQIASLKYDPETGSAFGTGLYLSPGHVSADTTTYESDVDTILTAITSVVTNLRAIEALV